MPQCSKHVNEEPPVTGTTWPEGANTQGHLSANPDTIFLSVSLTRADPPLDAVASPPIPESPSVKLRQLLTASNQAKLPCPDSLLPKKASLEVN